MQNAWALFGSGVSPLEYYREPLCFELAGARLPLAMEGGGELTLTFLSQQVVCVEGFDRIAHICAYECLKLARRLYMVNLLASQVTAAAVIAVDTDTGTAVLQRAGEASPQLGRFPCATGGQAAPVGYGFSGLTGHTQLWRYGSQHRFALRWACPNGCRLLYADPVATIHEADCFTRLFCLREDICLMVATPADGGEPLLMLMDVNTMRAIGFQSGISGAPQAGLFSAYGAFVAQDENPCALLVTDDLLHYQHRIVGKPIYNPATKNPVAGGLKQYAYPVSEELAGRTLDLRLDGQPPVLIRFQSATALAWAAEGKPFQQETYECVKGDDTVYLIVCHPREGLPAPCVTLVWDMQTRLVTAVLAWDKTELQYPRLVVSRAYFGAENREGEPLPTLRHQRTTDLIGRRFVWHYTANDDVLHICFDPTHFRLGRAKLALAPEPSRAAVEKYEQLLRRREKYPYYEEKVTYFRIRDGLYLYSVIEDAMCRLLGEQGGGELLALVNTTRVSYTGRSFGLDAQENAGHDLVGAPGSELFIPDEVESLPCPIYPLNTNSND